jgi:hypothetical protein
MKSTATSRESVTICKRWTPTNSRGHWLRHEVSERVRRNQLALQAGSLAWCNEAVPCHLPGCRSWGIGPVLTGGCKQMDEVMDESAIDFGDAAGDTVPVDPALTPELFLKWRAPRCGSSNPERMNNPV